MYTCMIVSMILNRALKLKRLVIKVPVSEAIGRYRKRLVTKAIEESFESACSVIAVFGSVSVEGRMVSFALLGSNIVCRH